MRSNFVWKVMYKELLSTVRDTRTIRSTILMPLILIPLFTIAFPMLIGSTVSGEQQNRQTVGVVGLQYLPEELRALLTEDRRGPDGQVLVAGVDLVEVTDPLLAVQDGEVDAAIEVPAPLPEQAGAAPAQVRLFSKQNSLRSASGAPAKVQEGLRAYNDLLVQAELREQGFQDNFLTPVLVEPVDASTVQEQRSGMLAFMIPLFILQFILAGGMATAIDSTAGEKERGTLEVLLVSPVRRLEVVVGKLLATTAFAVVSASFSVLGLLISTPVARALIDNPNLPTFQRSFGGALTLDVAGITAIFAAALSAALLLSAILIAIAIFARSFKEAQTYIAPVALLIVVPAVLLQFADFIDRSAVYYTVPLINTMLLILDTVKGAMVPTHALITLAVNLLATAVFVVLALRSFNREDVLFRS